MWRLEDDEIAPMYLCVVYFWKWILSSSNTVKNLGSQLFCDSLQRQLVKQLVIILASFPHTAADVQEQRGSWVGVRSEPCHGHFPCAASTPTLKNRLKGWILTSGLRGRSVLQLKVLERNNGLGTERYNDGSKKQNKPKNPNTSMTCTSILIRDIVMRVLVCKKRILK